MQTLTLNNGVEMPALGLGVFQTPPEKTRSDVETALATGYRHIDTAAAYGNEREVGEAVRKSGADATKPQRIAQNFDVFDFELTGDQLTAIDGLAPEPAAAPSRPTSPWPTSAGRSPKPERRPCEYQPRAIETHDPPRPGRGGDRRRRGRLPFVTGGPRSACHERDALDLLISRRTARRRGPDRRGRRAARLLLPRR